MKYIYALHHKFTLHCKRPKINNIPTYCIVPRPSYVQYCIILIMYVIRKKRGGNCGTTATLHLHVIYLINKLRTYF